MSRTISILIIVSVLIQLVVSLYNIEIPGGREDVAPPQEYLSQYMIGNY